jgi:predicted Ser/Thr protein kinase
MSRIGTPRNPTKASLRVERRGSVDVIVKDFGDRPRLVRAVFGRPTLRREARAYRRLEGLEGVPRFLGFEGADALVIERAEGRSLSEWPPERLPPGVWTRLERLLEQIHGRGVAVVDLHRSNVIVSEAGTVAIVDFALAMTGRGRPAAGRVGLLRRTAMQLDRHGLARMRARAEGRPDPAVRGGFGTVYRAGRRLKAFLRRLTGFVRS